MQCDFLRYEKETVVGVLVRKTLKLFWWEMGIFYFFFFFFFFWTFLVLGKKKWFLFFILLLSFLFGNVNGGLLFSTSK